MFGTRPAARDMPISRRQDGTGIRTSVAI